MSWNQSAGAVSLEGSRLADFSTTLLAVQVGAAELHRHCAGGSLPVSCASVSYDGKGAMTHIQLSWRSADGDRVNVSVSKRGYYAC